MNNHNQQEQHKVGDFATSERNYSFSASPQHYLLAAEAYRIAHAGMFDPMAAVAASNVEPLPHQIEAVYQEFLPRTPLRFLLADDPGAGKTIMAGLYLKEMKLRSACARALIIAPGGLVEQWQEELVTKFGLEFTILEQQLVEAADQQNKSVFSCHDYLLVRMDQLARNEQWLKHLSEQTWDIVVVDEAHRMSVHYSSWQDGWHETKRFKLGKQLAVQTTNLLLMTATPHAGKEEDFQAFLTLLDADRFAGQYDAQRHQKTDTSGLMRRLVKEELLTFEGKPLFPHRYATTVAYPLSPSELSLYENVTDYVRTNLGKAEQLKTGGESKRGNAIGFALQVLQRRLASSPNAIYESLKRRKARLELLYQQQKQTPDSIGQYQKQLLPNDLDSIDWDNLAGHEQKAALAAVEELVTTASAAQNLQELAVEINILTQLEQQAASIKAKGTDTKWQELATIIDTQILAGNISEARKLIIFTEHKDTLDYLERKITNLLGKPDSVVVIDGSISRKQRQAIQARFTQDPTCLILLATDAAGEGLNLQRAHLMVNYDLPWNPNRIEQRFGRIHRIGQKQPCYLWNMVAANTREGQVYRRLLEKISVMNSAYHGNLFNVLGDEHAFTNRSLRDLLLAAITAANQPAEQQYLSQIIDEAVAAGLNELLAEKQLHNSVNLTAIKEALEQARERRLQPGFIQAFFIPAFKDLGGFIHERETGRFEINRIPAQVAQKAQQICPTQPLSPKYERITFNTHQVNPSGRITAELLAPGHPLLDAVVACISEKYGPVLTSGTIFIDEQAGPTQRPYLLATVQQSISVAVNHQQKIAAWVDFVQLDTENQISISAAPAYLNFSFPTETELAAITTKLHSGVINLPTKIDEKIIGRIAAEKLIPTRRKLQQLRDRETDKVIVQVSERLEAERAYWLSKHQQLVQGETQGKTGKITAKTALTRIVDIETRLKQRREQLEKERKLYLDPLNVQGMALVIPRHVLEPSEQQTQGHTIDTQEVDRRAIAAVMAAEIQLGRNPVEQAHNNKGFDILSTTETGETYLIEVKGRIDLPEADSFFVTTAEIAHGQNNPDRHRLAMVRVSTQGPQADQVKYLSHAFDHLVCADTTNKLVENWETYWQKATTPH